MEPKKIETRKETRHTTVVTPFITSFNESGTRRLPAKEETKDKRPNKFVTKSSALLPFHIP